MTPRLAVTRDQVRHIKSAVVDKHGNTTVALRLPERPTMPCPECGGYGRHGGLRECSTCGIGSGSVPIPEGTRVEVGWWAGLYLGQEDWRNEWRPVAYATLAEVRDESCINPNDCCGYCPPSFVVTLSHIEPAGEDQ